MAAQGPNDKGRQLPVKAGSTTPVPKKKIKPLTKDAAEFLAKMDMKKSGPSDIANMLEQWLNNG